MPENAEPLKKQREVPKEPSIQDDSPEALERAETARKAQSLRLRIKKEVEEAEEERKWFTEEKQQEIFARLQKEHPDLYEQFDIKDVVDLVGFMDGTRPQDHESFDREDEIDRTVAQLWKKYRGEKFGPSDLRDMPTDVVEQFFEHYRNIGLHSSLLLFESAHEITRCKQGESLLRWATIEDPELAIDFFREYCESSYASKLLEIAVECCKKTSVLEKVASEQFFSDTPVAAEDRVRIIKMAAKKAGHRKLAEALHAGMSSPNVNTLTDDPALEHTTEIQEGWVDIDRFNPPFVQPQASVEAARTDFQRAQLKAMIARNLFFQDRKVTEENVRREFERILQTREQYGLVALFRGRNVLFAAHSELEEIREKEGEIKKEKENREGIGKEEEEKVEQPRGIHRFGKKAACDAIRDQQAERDSLKLIRPEENTLQSLLDAKNFIIDQIKLTPPPFTFVFDGHGGPDAIYLSQGIPGAGGQIRQISDTESTVKITADELADAFRERESRFFPLHEYADPAVRDIVIFAACFPSDLIRNIYTKIGRQTFVAIGGSEYGQYGYSDRSPLGSKFFSKVLNLQSEKPTTIGTVFENERKGDSKPSIYIPAEEERLMQISRHKGRMLENRGDVV